MLTYQSVKETYRQILAKNPGKALRLYEASRVLVVLDGDTLRWGPVSQDGSIGMTDMPEMDGYAWMGCGWFGEHEATKKAIDNPILLDLPSPTCALRTQENSIPLTFESAMSSYRQILEQNPGKAMRMFEPGFSDQAVVLVDGKLFLSKVYADGSVAGEMAELTDYAWIGGGWIGKAQATQDGINNPILLDLTSKTDELTAQENNMPLTYESALSSYRSILEKNPGKALRIYDASVGVEAAVLMDGKVFWAEVNLDDSVTVEKYEMTDNAWRGDGWFGQAQATRDGIRNPVLIDLPVESLTLATAPAGSPAGLVRVQAPWSGEMLRGMRVAAWRWKDGRGFWDYATHWSTGPQDRQERVYTEADMLAVLASRDSAIAALKALEAESALDCSGCETDDLLVAKDQAKAVLKVAGESDFDRVLMQVLES